MAVADLVAEFFDTEPLRATIAARGIFGTFLGPWSAGSALVLLLRAAADPHQSPAGSIQFPAGGAGAITLAMAAAAKQAGAEIRTGAEIAEIRVKDGVATGVVLASGEEISARAVVSNADPKRTLMRLVDPAHLSPDFIQKIKNYRSLGTVAKINLALSALPEFTALKAKGSGSTATSNGNCSRAAFRSAPKSITWSAPSTNRSTAISRATHILKLRFRRFPILRSLQPDSM
jgi:phytoene dehydrogenase-like protein